MERSFAKEIESLKLGKNEVFYGEGILAITKALLQSGVSYIGGYQGAPISHLIDVLGEAEEILDDLGVHFEYCPNEAAAAAMLGASINYPLRGAATWKSVVGTNVASDALSNLASAGVVGGAVIIVGEDYGEGASIIQERSHAFALKSSIWLLDPRPGHEKFVDLIEQSFQLSEASNTPVMVEFRIRACHVFGSFVCKENRTPEYSRKNLLSEPEFDPNRICLPPGTYHQEKHKVEIRLPAAVDFIRKHRLNEIFPGDADDVGIILQGGLYNSVLRALKQLGLADSFGQCRIPLLVLNVTHPLVPDEVTGFCQGKKAVLMIEEGQPDYLEQALHVLLRKENQDTAVYGKNLLPMAGEYTGRVLLEGIAEFVSESRSHAIEAGPVAAEIQRVKKYILRAAKELGPRPVPKRPPSFCTGCPERPIFSAIKIMEKEFGKVHVSSDIGCHTFSTLPPFNLGNTVMGYGLSLAGSTAVGPAFDKRVISIMGDGGFWHNGLTSGVVNSQFNKKSDSILMVVNNGYTSATGQQYIPSSNDKTGDKFSDISIQSMLKGLGVRWVRKISSYQVRKMLKILRTAMTSKEGGLKVILAEGECQLVRQRRVKPENQKKILEGKRVVQTRFGIDASVCTGDHSCIRLSGCPSLTIKASEDPLRRDPVATVDNNCVGCGLCGEIAHTVALCPSFYRTEIVHNPLPYEVKLNRIRSIVIRIFQFCSGDRKPRKKEV
ncbi:MAG: indolepyruvate ferredoxin oxidoreductase subunit alpha [SAR324 cluster bacterium]|nr:indolepyruvate ferredoxin oxidoreductase subunit alpha [SAR324 cluster bacterium]